MLNRTLIAIRNWFDPNLSSRTPKYRIDGWAVYDFNDDFVSFQPGLARPATYEAARDHGYRIYPAVLLTALPEHD